MALLIFSLVDRTCAQDTDSPWSYRPLHSGPLTSPADDGGWARNPVDALILSRLQTEGLSPSPPAPRITLIRRVTIDLTGLPPTPAEIDHFLADPGDDAYPRLVERLLSSPRYGERWARHWLDVVHYGDTHGYDKDKPRLHAWPYRDYVVRAFNEDKPYGRFVREQLAGDVLFPGSSDGLVATGFLAAGPWDFIGHAEVPETKIDGRIARHLDRDDMVRTTMNTFVSLTVQCARCHDHKFDAVSMSDYYSLQAVFAAIDRADQPFDPEPGLSTRRVALRKQSQHIAQQLAGLNKELSKRGAQRLTKLRNRLNQLGRTKGSSARPQFGYHSQIAPRPNMPKWVQVDLGRSMPLAQVVLVGCHDDFNNIGAGFGFPPRFRIDVSDDPRFEENVTCIADHTSFDFPNPGTRPLAFAIGGRTGRYVRVTATRLALRNNDYIFALSELAVLNAGSQNLSFRVPVSALDSIEAGPRWRRANLVDGFFDRVPLTTQLLKQIIDLDAQRRALRQQLLTPEWVARQRDLRAQLARVKSREAGLPPTQLVYVGAVHTGQGNFRGTGHEQGRPRPIHILERGDIRRPGLLVGPGTIPLNKTLPTRFQLPPDHNESDRRVALASWIVAHDNPLTWRSIANRVWQYHIGRPLVDTPNDFGQMGAAPTHPQLLDWLAVRLRNGNGSLKDLHRQIVLSATYQQVSESRPKAHQFDSGNRFLWRMNRRRVEAEVIRDSVLAISGQLDTKMYGPGFQDFVIERPEHSPHYQYHKHDPEDIRSHRRSIYRFLVRSQQQPFMTTLDCADPSRQVARRDETISPLQALAMLNNRFVTSMSSHFAARLSRDRTDLTAQIELAYRLAFCRRPQAAELELLVPYAGRHGLPNLCRLMLNLNEFVFID